MAIIEAATRCLRKNISEKANTQKLMTLVYAVKHQPPYEDLREFVSYFWKQPKEDTGNKRYVVTPKNKLHLYGKVHICGRYVCSWQFLSKALLDIYI